MSLRGYKSSIGEGEVIMDPKTRLDSIREREKAATRGPWRWWTSNSHRRLSSDATGKDGDVIHAAYNPHDHFPEIGVTDADMEFIAASREDVPWLVQLVERKNAALRAAKRQHDSNCNLEMDFNPDVKCSCGAAEHNAAIDKALEDA